MPASIGQRIGGARIPETPGKMKRDIHEVSRILVQTSCSRGARSGEPFRRIEQSNPACVSKCRLNCPGKGQTGSNPAAMCREVRRNHARLKAESWWLHVERAGMRHEPLAREPKKERPCGLLPAAIQKDRYQKSKRRIER